MSFVYAAKIMTNTINVIDAKTNYIIAKIQSNLLPLDIKVIPNGQYVYVVISQAPNVGDTVFVIDIKKNVVIATVVVGHTPTNILADPSGCYVYVIGILLIKVETAFSFFVLYDLFYLLKGFFSFKENSYIDRN
ncbi:hypothetical protein IC620_02525 [Hazenella sp. IB182357]|uniref:Uncharacterized protein n=1 Tax=Polycladospora coralii TaxID=2771432 RepID=A0A926N8F9_9BACL|nr:hypothetical protein [Polycladospora coralii]MBD1371232.1 hypothetical protein [Polycladospora coralii]